jgi:hypothetical protein
LAGGQQPIMVLMDLHADPMPGNLQVQQQIYQDWVDASNWTLDVTDPRGAKVSFLSTGQFMEWVLADPVQGHPLMQRLYASGDMLGTHSHKKVKIGPYNWQDLGPNPTQAEIDQLWNDHIGAVNAVITAALGVSDPNQIRAINCSRGSHLPSDDAQRIQMMADFGFTNHQQGPGEQFYAYFKHYPMNPFRPSGTWFMEHDPTTEVIVVPFGPVLGNNSVHFNILQDMRMQAVQARFLLELLNWLNDVHVAQTERVWVTGWAAHCSDVVPGTSTRDELAPVLDWFIAHFIGQQVSGRVAASFASVPEARDAYYTWEANHPGEISFSYPVSQTNWGLYPYLIPAVKYLTDAWYEEAMPQVGIVRWHRFTAAADIGGPYDLYVAYPIDDVPDTVDLSSWLGVGDIAVVDPATGVAQFIPTDTVTIEKTGNILVPPNKVISLEPGGVYEPKTVHDVDLLPNGNILATDGGTIVLKTDGGIYEIDRAGNLVWSYSVGLNWAHNADKQADGTVIISDTGNDRVIVVDQNGAIIWNSDNITFSDGSSLAYPNDANLLVSGNLLITDRDNHRVIEMDASGNIVWQFGETAVPGGGATHLRGPHNADRLANGNTIIADSNNNRIIEVDVGGTIVWPYAGGLNWPRDADRLDNGNTLINDSSNRRIIEVTSGGTTVWTYNTDKLSYDSDRLDNGNTLISEQDRIIEVDSGGTIVWVYPIVYLTEVIEGYLVTAPNGNQLWTKIIQPRSGLYPGQSFPAIISVPGGLGAGENRSLGAAELGFVEFHFNAEGRGVSHPSDGVEDHNGFIHQDDLKAMIEFAHSRSNVIDENVGVTTSSYGITMGAGCLGRYPALQVKYLLDIEGPSESFVSSHEPWSLDADPSNDKIDIAYNNFGHWSTYRDPSPANVAWWSEREATGYIGQARCRYLRVQAEWDHAQPPNAQWPGFDYPPLWYQCKHGVDMVNLATLGRSPWTRMNGPSLANPTDQTYSREQPPIYYTGRWQDHPDEFLVVLKELADMPSLPPISDYDGDGDVDGDDFDLFQSCTSGPAIPLTPGCEDRDLDMDNDADQNDFGLFQRCYSGESVLADPNCAN